MPKPVMIPVNVIYSFDDYEQECVDTTLPLTATEDQVLDRLFSLFLPGDLDKLASLYKISTAQTRVGGKYITHLVDRNGKYYFNPAENDDDDVRALATKRDAFVKAHAAQQAPQAPPEPRPAQPPATPAKAAKPATKAAPPKAAKPAKPAKSTTTKPKAKAKTTTKPKAKTTTTKTTAAKRGGKAGR